MSSARLAALSSARALLRRGWVGVVGRALGTGLFGLAIAGAWFWPARLELAGGQGLAGIFFPGPRSHYLGKSMDLVGTMWTFDHVARMLRGEVGTYNDQVFAPVGWDQGIAQGFAWADAILAAPLVMAMGPRDFYNLYLLLLLTACTMALVGLARAAGAPRWVALGLACVTMFNGFFGREITWGRPTQIHLLFQVGFLWMVLRLMSPARRPVRDGLLGGAMLAASGYVYWFQAISVGVVGATALALHLLVEPRARRERALGGAVLAVTALVLAVVPTWRMSGELLVGDPTTIYAWFDKPPRWSMNLGLITIPIREATPIEPRLGALLSALRDVGYPVVLLALAPLAALPWARRGAGPWAVAALGWSGIALGPGLIWGDVAVVPTPNALLEAVLPLLKRCHDADRLMLGPLLGLVVAAAAAAGAAEARSLATGRWRWWGLAAGLALLAAGAHTRPGPAFQPTTRHLDQPVLLREAVASWPGGIIDVPISGSNVFYAYQLEHRRPLLGGPGVNGPHTQPEAHKRYLKENTVLRMLETLTGRRATPDEHWNDEDLERLRADGFGIILVHLGKDASRLAAFEEVLGPAPLRQGLSLAAWPLPEPR